MSLKPYILFILLFATTDPALSAISQAPVDATVIQGENVTLQCVSDSAGDLVEWRVFSKSDPIFSSTEEISNTDKYARAGTRTDYSLTVKNTLWADGGRYSCSSFAGTTNEAQLVVLGQPAASFGTLIEGHTTQLRCDVTVASDKEGNLEETHYPKLRAYIDGVLVGAPYTWDDQGPGQNSSISLTVVYTIIRTHHGKNFTCEAFTEKPAEKVRTDKLMEINYPASDLLLAPRNQEHAVGDYINCTAQGHPEPTISWHCLESAGERPVSGSQLGITSAMVGYNRWQCQANNQYNTEPIRVEIEFTVVGRSGSQTTTEGVTEPNKAAMTGKGVSDLSVLVCGAWVLVLVGV